MLQRKDLIDIITLKPLFYPDAVVHDALEMIEATRMNSRKAA